MKKLLFFPLINFILISSVTAQTITYINKDSVEIIVDKGLILEQAFYNSFPSKTPDNIYFTLDSFSYTVFLNNTGYRYIGHSLNNRYILPDFINTLSYIRRNRIVMQKF